MAVASLAGAQPRAAGRPAAIAVPAALVVAVLAVVAGRRRPTCPSWLDTHLQPWVRSATGGSSSNRKSHWLFTDFFNPIADALDVVRASGAVVAAHAAVDAACSSLTGAIGWRTGGLRAAFWGAAAMVGVGVLGVLGPDDDHAVDHDGVGRHRAC